MFSGNRRKYKVSDVETIIGSRTILHGDVLFSGGLHVDGSIKGNVLAEEDADAVLILGERGSIEGEVKAPHVILNGAVTGDVHASVSVELSPRARVTGSVFYKVIEMAMGAEVNGNLVHLAEDKETPVVKQQVKKEMNARTGSESNIVDRVDWSGEKKL
jgi:cytoskeletal protein CcmA (bactofilin family)